MPSILIVKECSLTYAFDAGFLQIEGPVISYRDESENIHDTTKIEIEEGDTIYIDGVQVYPKPKIILKIDKVGDITRLDLRDDNE